MKNNSQDIIRKLVKESLDAKLIESVLDEDYPTTWDIDQFKALTSFKQRIKYCQENLQRISSGSSRIVYKIDDTKVLKLAKNQRGVAQNETEIEWGQDGYYGQILAKTIDSEPNGLWVEMQLARSVSKAKFESFFGFTTNLLHEYLYNECNHQSRMKFDIDPKVVNVLNENEFVNVLLNFIRDTDSEKTFGDFAKLSSFGLVNRHGSEEIVFIDYGLTSAVYDSYYK